MQDPSDSSEIAAPEEENRGKTADLPVVNDPAPGGDADPTAASTILAEILPGIVVVCGDVPAELKTGLVDFGIVSAADRKRVSAFVASIGNTATVAGNLANAYAGVQGLYRVSSATQALLNAGATLAVKDGANLGAVFLNGKIIAQARLIPVTAVSAAQTAATLGPALAMVALQMQLSEIAGLVRTNIALTSQVLKSIRSEQWSELNGLVATIDHTVDQARAIGAVPASLWENVAGSEASLRKQLELYRQNVHGHVGHINQTDARLHREYLQTNAEAIVFDAYALMSSLKAWIGYQALRAGKARAAGRKDPDETRLVDVIARDTRTEFDSALAEMTGLVASLTRELRIIAELGGPDALSPSLIGKQKDSKAARETAARLLKAIEPLADVLRPPSDLLAAPDVVCAPETLDHEPYLRILGWFLENDEPVRVLAFADQLDALGPTSSILGGVKGKLAAAMDKTDKASANTLVVITDRRIITARTNAFLDQGEIRRDVPIDQVRYVRAATAQDNGERLAIDLITRDENFRWLFRSDIDHKQVDALAAVLAESMTIPDTERAALVQRRHASIASGK
ncbi:hypothetical protein ACPA54_36125 [Uniformispora flossi]|uniref:hypothetical protein n=1 Tax=Uniformispora flossi TaxID=3390723 RepID=UPI003C2E03FF